MLRSFLFTKMMALDASFKKIISQGLTEDTQVIDIKVMANVQEFHAFINFVLGRLRTCEISEPGCPTCSLAGQLHALRHSYAEQEKFTQNDIRVLYSGDFKTCTKYSIVITAANTEDVVYHLKFDIAG